MFKKIIIEQMMLMVAFWCIALPTLSSCAKASDPIKPELSISSQELIFSNQGETKRLSVQSNVEWSASSSDSWLTLTPSKGGNSTTEIQVAVAANPEGVDRSAVIRINAQGLVQQVKVIQAPRVSYAVDPDQTGMSSDAKELAAKIRVGWNLGNALEAASSPSIASETLWGNPKTTKALIDAVKEAGFNAVRIPCAWSGYIEDPTTYRIKGSWLARVKEVVDYCVDNDMYAIINIHWDGGWLEEHPLYTHQVQVNAKQKALWEQIATYFRNYDERLLFAGTNEVRANYNAPTTENITVQQSYNQTFVTAVRSTGGRNAYRNLIVQSYNTNIQFAVDHLTLPTDVISDRMMAEVHFYDPWDFAGDPNSDKYLWGHDFSGSANVSTWGQEASVDANFEHMKTKFVNNGIPVVLGEYGAIFRSGLTDPTALQDHTKARNNYLTYVTKKAKENGMLPFYWDNGFLGNGGFGLFDRTTNQVADQDAVSAIMAGL